MPLYENMHGSLKDAMKSGDARRRDALRLLESALKNEAIEARKPVTELSDEEVISVLRRLSKQRRESAESYRAGGRADLAEQEEFELSLIDGYLPAAMPDDELRKIVADTIVEVNASSKADFGKVMGSVMKKVSGRADGNAVKRFVEEALS